MRQHEYVGFRPAFTLVELLVALGLAALLLTLLLPALSTARDTARRVACAGHLRTIGQAVSIYATTWRGYMPGPDTSGARYGAANNVSGHWFRRDGSPDTPLLNMDWFSPLLGRDLGFSGSGVRFHDRLKDLYATDVSCPANAITYDFIYPTSATMWFGHDVRQIRYFSYSAILGFTYDVTGNGDVAIEDKAALRGFPATYSPKVDNVGPSAAKVFAVEGTRFVNGGLLSFNDLPWQFQGGNFMISGPHDVRAGDPFVFTPAGEPTEDARRTAFRHPKGTMNAVFFDGHVEQMDGRAARNPHLYVPRGTNLGAGGLAP